MGTKGTPLRVYSIYTNIINYVFGNKNVKLNKILKSYVFEKKSNQFVKDQCFRIYNEIENSFYSYNDLTIALLFISFRDKPNLKNIDRKLIIKCLKHFDKKQLKEDEKFILDLNKELKFNNIKEYFNIISGESIICELFLKGLISPLFFIKYFNLLPNNEKKEYKHIVRITKELKKLIKL